MRCRSAGSAVGEGLDLVDGQGRRVTGTVSAVVDRQCARRGGPVRRGRAGPAAPRRRRAGTAEGRSRRARGRAAHRDRRRRDRAVGGGQLRDPVEGRPRRARPPSLGGRRAGGGQAGPPRAVPRGRAARLDRRRARAHRGRQPPRSSCTRRRRTSIAAVAAPAHGDLVLVVGPEGGLTPAERASLSEAGAAEVRLGPSVLRTSSAGIAAVAALLAPTVRAGRDSCVPTATAGDGRMPS